MWLVFMFFFKIIQGLLSLRFSFLPIFLTLPLKQDHQVAFLYFTGFWQGWHEVWGWRRKYCGCGEKNRGGKILKAGTDGLYTSFTYDDICGVVHLKPLQMYLYIRVIYRVFFFTGTPKKLKYGKPRLGESMLNLELLGGVPVNKTPCMSKVREPFRISQLFIFYISIFYHCYLYSLYSFIFYFHILLSYLYYISAFWKVSQDKDGGQLHKMLMNKAGNKIRE